MQEIENKKIDHLLVVTEFYCELRKKISKCVDKSEKAMQVKVNQAYSEAISILNRAN